MMSVCKLKTSIPTGATAHMEREQTLCMKSAAKDAAGEERVANNKPPKTDLEISNQQKQSITHRRLPGKMQELHSIVSQQSPLRGFRIQTRNDVILTTSSRGGPTSNARLVPETISRGSDNHPSFLRSRQMNIEKIEKKNFD
jgi:hypothetical protein